MKRTSTALLISLFMMAQALAGPELTPLEGGIADPVFNLPDLTDGSHALQDYRGKVVLVNFWASWCPPCVYEMPDLERLRETFGDDPFEILAVNVGEQKFRVWKFDGLVGFDLPVLLDPRKEVFRAWGLAVLPTSFLVDADGHIRYRVEGAPEWRDAQTLSLIRELLEQPETTQ